MAEYFLATSPLRDPQRLEAHVPDRAGEGLLLGGAELVAEEGPHADAPDAFGNLATRQAHEGQGYNPGGVVFVVATTNPDPAGSLSLWAGVRDGLVAVVKRECPTCQLVAPVLADLEQGGQPLTIYSQDDPAFPSGLRSVQDDTDLSVSFGLDIEVVPSLLLLEDGRVVRRTEGWHRQTWRELTGLPDLGADLPELRPGCGSRTVEPGMAERLAVRFGTTGLRARQIVLAELEDAVEACFERGWTDGLPAVPPTPERVLGMLQGTSRAPDNVVAVVPPNLEPCTVEKVAINAVLAGCRPDYLPVVISALEAACTDGFNIHGVLATTYFAGPVVIVNGPIARSIGMNSGGNALGQGNRANATIGRALQLIIRNVGGGRPGGVDRATLGQPGKYTFCFAEDEAGSPWEPLSVERGLPPGTSAVTLFAGEGPRAVVDQRSRSAASLARSFAACLRTVAHPKLVGWPALVVVSPEHARVFREDSWSKQRLRAELLELLSFSADELCPGADGIEEGTHVAGAAFKFKPEGLLFVHAGGQAGLFSAIVGGWGGAGGSQPVTVEVRG
jgi:hypothetical protein